MKKIGFLCLFSAAFLLNSADFLIDRYGQFAHIDYEGKVKSDEELLADVEADKQFYNSFKLPDRTFWGSIPGSREKYGLTATGFFHLQKIPALRNRVMLVDPEGNLYFHLGVCSAMPGNEFTMVYKRENVYEWLPTAQDPKFKTARWGHCASFYLVNWLRKFGSYDEVEWQKTIVERLRRFGFNAFGEFTAVFPGNDKLGFAFTKCIERYWSDKRFTLVGSGFIDPFAETTPAILEDIFTKRTKPFLKNPALIGYYTENEVNYPRMMELLLQKTDASPAKAEFADFMQKRYKNDIAAFNKNWKTSFSSFSGLKSAALKTAGKESQEDAKAYERHHFDTYYRILSTALKKADPDHLFLGERILPGQIRNDLIISTMSKYVDAFSANYYCDGYLTKEVLHMIETSGKPIMLSEWSFGSPEQGLFGVRNLKNKQEVAEHYRRYVENAAATPGVLGVQWFCLLDESNTGRGWDNYFGERCNTGFFNVCDRPYKQLARAAHIANNNVYPIIEGKLRPVPTRRYPRLIEAWWRADGNVKKLSNAKLDLNMDKYSKESAGTVKTSYLTFKDTKNQPAQIRYGWDENHFFIYVRVADRTPAYNRSRDILADDSVEIFLGEDPRVSGPMLPADRQLIVRVNRKKMDHEWRCHGKKVQTDSVPQMVCRESNDGSSYEVEIAVPWKETAIKPAAGEKFLFDVIVNIGDRGKIRERLIYNGGEYNDLRRDYWGTCILQN